MGKGLINFTPGFFLRLSRSHVLSGKYTSSQISYFFYGDLFSSAYLLYVSLALSNALHTTGHVVRGIEAIPVGVWHGCNFSAGSNPERGKTSAAMY